MYLYQGSNLHLGEVLRKACNIFLTSHAELPADRIVVPSSSPCPLTTERRVEDNCMVMEYIINCASSLEVGTGLPPTSWVRVSLRDVLRRGSAREEPDSDPVRCPFHGIDSALVSIERGPIGYRCCVVDDTASIVGGADRVLESPGLEGAGCATVTSAEKFSYSSYE